MRQINDMIVYMDDDIIIMSLLDNILEDRK